MGSREIDVVRRLEVRRYMGRWYEIASLPSRHQPRDGENTRATYVLEADGATVRVLNETWSGKWRASIEGTAYKADPNTNEAKLKVKYYVPPFMPVIPVVWDYWVIYVDRDYQCALVGSPDRRGLLILCRQPQMDDDSFNLLVQKAIEQGYDVKKLRMTPHSDTPPEVGQGIDDTKGIWWIKSIFGR